MLKRIMAVLISFGLMQSGAARAEESAEHVDIPGGGKVAELEGFKSDRYYPEIGRPTEFVMMYKGYRHNIGGYAKVDAGLAIAHTSLIPNAGKLVQEAGIAFRDGEWEWAVRREAGPLELQGGYLVSSSGKVEPGWLFDTNTKKWIVVKAHPHAPYLAALFVKDTDMPLEKAKALVDLVVDSIEPEQID